MKRFHRFFMIWGTVVSMVVLVLVLSVATYAWFTVNRTVSTNRVTARTGEDTLELQISAEGGTAFSGAEEAVLTQINAASLEKLMPVSTADLKTFVYNPFTDNDMASSFKTVENEAYYYHGRVYLRAAAQGQSPDARLALYLDGDNTPAEAERLLNAARLGLTFDGGSPVIFYLTDEENEPDAQVRNTLLDGTMLGDGQVLTVENNVVTAAPDPALSLESRTVTLTDTVVTRPEAPLLEMELNRIYAVDVYFYLEGCDPDCSDIIGMDEVDLQLAFYGILTE